MKKIAIFTAAILITLTIFIFRAQAQTVVGHPGEIHAILDGADGIYEAAPALPKSLKVGSFVYSVSFSPDLAAHDELGTMNCDTLRISIQDGLSVQKQREVILHEALHTAYCVPNILAGEKPAFTEEQSVYLTAPHLVMILRDNPDLVKFLTQ